MQTDEETPLFHSVNVPSETHDGVEGQVATSMIPSKENVKHMFGRVAHTLGGSTAVRTFAVIINLATCVLAVFSIVWDILKPWNFVIDLYIFLLCAMLLTIELAQAFPILKAYKVKVEFWVRLLTRAWGKGLMLMLVGLLGVTKGGLFWILDGVFLLLIGGLYFLNSYNASKKLKQAQEKAREHFSDNWLAMVKKYDLNNDGEFDIQEISRIVQDLNIEMSLNEIQLVANYLDRNNNGNVSTEEFKDWCLFNKVDGKFL